MAATLADRLGPGGQVVFSALGIYFFYLYYGVLQERIYRPDPETGEKFGQTLFLLTVQCLFNFALGAMALFLSGSGTKKPMNEKAATTPFPIAHSGRVWIGLISLSYIVAMACSNGSLKYVSYPFQALAKSCKMVPVMLANVFIGKNRYSVAEYMVVILITIGVVLFQMSDSKGSFLEGNTWYGIVLLLASLALDGLTSSNQKLFSDEFKPSGHYIMMQMNMWSLIFLAPALIVTGDGMQGLSYCLSHSQTLYDIVMFSICSSIGQQFIFFCIVGPGPLVCTTITTTRKFFTVLLSILWYPDNKLSTWQWVAVSLVFAGLLIELLHKKSPGKKGEKKKE